MTTATLDVWREESLKTLEKTADPANIVETWRRMPFQHWGLDRFSAENAAGPKVTLEGGAGAEVLTLEEAVAAKESFVLPTLKTGLVSSDFLKFESVSIAAWSGGAFVHVPKGKKIEEPIRISFEHDGSKTFQLPRVVVFLEEGAEATIVEEHLGDASASLAFTRIELAQNASLRYFYTQELPKDAVHFSHQHVALGKDARLDHNSIIMGAQHHKSELEVLLNGRGAQSDLRGVLFGSEDQFFDPHTHQLHRASNTMSDMHFRVALRDKARSIYTGLIRIEKDAVDCEAYQQNKNLLLSDGARADSTPVLEILPDRVACKHGSTAGPVDKNQLFYLAARGIPPAEAAEMLVMGFFEPILERLPFEDMRERLRAVVAAGAQI
ncbi:MAG: Fe-S cluster assembly protein SufD [Elusimicrobia bacterium]|nr:MAG: Fe-S cluster assembly protein SufD [Elusimicrobiota bacterium]